MARSPQRPLAPGEQLRAREHPTIRELSHLFRHSTTTLMLDAGADVRHVAEMLGRQKLETTMDYTRVSMGKLQVVLSTRALTRPSEDA